MNTALLSESDLKTWTGFSRRSDIERLLRKHGVPIIYGRDGQICTTLDASGHKDPRMLAVYDRLPGMVKPTK